MQIQKVHKIHPFYLVAVGICLTSLLTLFYFGVIASPVYISTTKFAVRNATGNGSGLEFGSTILRSDMNSYTDAGIVAESIASPDIFTEIDKTFPLWEHFSDTQHDVLQRITQDATLDEKSTYWKWVVTPVLDPDTGIISVEVKAFSAEMAHALTEQILKESEALVNQMNARAQQDAVNLAQKEVLRAEERMLLAQEQLRNFRNKHGLIDPAVTVSGLQGIITGLESDIVHSRAELSEKASFMNPNAPAIKSLQKHLAAIQQQLIVEKKRLSGLTSNHGSLNSLFGEYQMLMLEQEFAQQQLVTAMTAIEAARVQALSQSRYIVAFQQPSLPDESLYPNALLFSLYVFLGLSLIVGIVSLICAAIREHVGF